MFEQILEWLDVGGPVVYVLAVLSLISITIIVMKAVKFSSVLSGKKRIEAALAQVQQRQNDMAMQELKSRSPAERVLEYAIAAVQNRIPQNVLEYEVERRGNAEIEILNRGIRVLEIIALISPLLGLLGTVLGMIQSFQELEMAEGAANASVLAGGIWQALLTTAVGLVVAIPAAIGASMFSATVERVAHRIETSAGRLYLLVNAPQSQ